MSRVNLFSYLVWWIQGSQPFKYNDNLIDMFVCPFFLLSTCLIYPKQIFLFFIYSDIFSAMSVIYIHLCFFLAQKRHKPIIVESSPKKINKIKMTYQKSQLSFWVIHYTWHHSSLLADIYMTWWQLVIIVNYKTHY